MADTYNLVGTTWRFNNTITYFGNDGYSINFISNGITWYAIYSWDTSWTDYDDVYHDEQTIFYSTSDVSHGTAIFNGEYDLSLISGLSDAYRTIEITLADNVDSYFYNWLQNNATLIDDGSGSGSGGGSGMNKNIFVNALVADQIFWGALAEVEKVFFGNILVWEKASALPLLAPTIELTDDGLDIYDNSEGLAESFNIYVNDTKVKTVTNTFNLLGTSWHFNEILNLPEKTSSQRDLFYSLEFITNNQTNKGDDGYIVFIGGQNEYIGMAYAGEAGYMNGNWQNSGYRNITFIGGADVVDQDFINWLQANATRTS